MPITGTGVALGMARKAAKEAVSNKWRAMNRELTPGEIDQLKLEMEEADSTAILAHLTALATVVGTAGPPGALPVLGTIT